MHPSPGCEKCSAETEYQGRISLPPQLIYRCKACGHQMWMQAAWRTPGDQQQPAQQQQQPQPKKDVI